MVRVTIPETPVSEQIGLNDSITVPSGEVWQVRLGMSDSVANAKNDHSMAAAINGRGVWEVQMNSGSGLGANFTGPVVVLDSGDTVDVEQEGGVQGSNAGLSIQGFDVSSVVDNRVISIQLAPGESFTVPSGEVWRVAMGAGEQIVNKNNHAVVLTINGFGAYEFNYSDASDGNSRGPTMTLVGGDTVKLKAENTVTSPVGAYIQGFRVD